MTDYPRIRIGREYILEVNGTSSGLCPEQADEDNAHIRDLTLAKMDAELCPAAAGALEGEPGGAAGVGARSSAPSV